MVQQTSRFSDEIAQEIIPTPFIERKTTQNKYCYEFGISCATTFRIHGTSDMNVATQRSVTDLAFPMQQFSKYTVQS
jgi:hypothetical protein